MRYRAPLYIGLLLLLLLASCGGLGGEPEIVRTFAPPTPLPDDILPPLTPPDLALGRQVYIQNCTACHGLNGAGDGEILDERPDMVPGNFIIADANAGQTPLEWYTTVTNGNLVNLMPPWRDALTEAERWAVAMYTYTLHYTPEQVSAGAMIAEATPVLADFLETLTRDQAQMVSLTDGALRTLIRENAPDLTDAEIRAVQMSARLGSLLNTDAIFLENIPVQSPESTEEALTAEATEAVGIVTDRIGVVRGTVMNGTDGEDTPAGLPVLITVFDQEFNIATYEDVTDDNGEYAVEDIPLAPELFYIAQVDYRERQFFGRYDNTLTDADESIDIPVNIYELTEDPNVITILSDVMQVRPVANTLEILHIMRYRNDSDRAFTSTSILSEGRFASVLVSLPVGAIILGFDNNQRYSVIEEDFSFVDSALVLPGNSHFTTVTYLLPYVNNAVIEYPVNYPFDGEQRILIDSAEMTLDGEDYVSRGEEQIGESLYNTYGATLTLNAGDVIRFELNGGGTGIGTSTDSGVVTSDNLLAVLAVAVVGLLGIGIGVYFYFNRSAKISAPIEADMTVSPRAKDHEIDALVRQIAQLDARHDVGQINHDVYHAERKALKAQLASLMGTDDTSD